MGNLDREDVTTKKHILAVSDIQMEIVTIRAGVGAYTYKITYIWAKVGEQWYCYQNICNRVETDVWVRVPHYDETTFDRVVSLIRSIYDDWAETPKTGNK